MSKEEGEGEGDSMMAMIKYHLDWLYYVGECEEACRIGKEYIRAMMTTKTMMTTETMTITKITKTGVRREIYESILVCATKVNNRDLALEMLDYLESLDVQDSGLDYVCYNSRKTLGLLI